MPKIEVNEKLFFDLVGRTWDAAVLEEKLQSAKAELDGWDKSAGTPAERSIKIELNDTNRPDLWSTAGVARAMRVREDGKIPEYPFFSRAGAQKDTGTLRVVVDPALEDIRPFIAAFVISGKPISDAMLKDIIQTQEKLCWNYGRKRRSIAMGVYRSAMIKYPVRYKAADPKATKFVPLGLDEELSLEGICEKHPKGLEYGHIVKGFSEYPFLTDDAGEVLSFPPVINSARIGAVEVGDQDLFVEMTGTDIRSLAVAASIVACDFADAGYSIKPVTVEYPYDTPFGRKVAFPFYFQEPMRAGFDRMARFLGEKIDGKEAVQCLAKVGVRAKAEGDGVVAETPEYRNDFLHAADVVEDVMIGRGMASFRPERPRDFTIGRLSPVELLSRKAVDLMVGMGFQEMVFNYLGSGRDYIERMGIEGEEVLRISNPMSESFEYVRASIIPSLLSAESGSASAVFPHRTFEVGKVAYKDAAQNYGSVTRASLGFEVSSNDANFNETASIVAALCYYLGIEYKVEEADDPRFIPGRQAALLLKGKRIGVLGEVHPRVLEAWGLSMPCAAFEMDLESLLE